MPAEIHLPATLPPLFAGLPREVAVDAPTVIDAIRELDSRWPGLFDRICVPGPALRPHINVFVDRRQADLHSPIAHGSRVDVITAISGG